MISFVSKYGEARARNTVVAALYLATGREGRRPFTAEEIRRYALEMISASGEDGSISPEMVNRVLAPINGEVLEVAERENGRYMLKEIARSWSEFF